MKPIFKIGGKDLLRGLILMALTALFSVPVDLLANYVPILQNPFIALILSTFLGYLSKNLATDENGKLGGHVQLY